jgi:2-oxoglutarate ferredoxin oxidoreductase subunit alpha
MLASIPARADVEEVDDADAVVVAFGMPAKYVRAAVRGLRSEGLKVGFVRPITLQPFPSELMASIAERVGKILVYENSGGQMVDDVRLAVLGRCPVEFIGRLSMEKSAFGIAPDLEVGWLRDRIRTALSTEGATR